MNVDLQKTSFFEKKTLSFKKIPALGNLIFQSVIFIKIAAYRYRNDAKMLFHFSIEVVHIEMTQPDHSTLNIALFLWKVLSV